MRLLNPAVVVVVLLLLGCCVPSHAAGPPAKSPPLIVEEYKIVKQGVATPDRYEYSRRIPASVLSKRKRWRELPYEDRESVDFMNGKLENTDYRFVKLKGEEDADYGCELRMDGKKVLGPLFMIERLTVNTAGNRFLFVAQEERGRDWCPILCVDGKSRPWNSVSAEGPVFVGDDLVWVQEDSKKPGTRKGYAAVTYSVKKNGRIVHALTTDENPVRGEIETIRSVGADWIVEYEDNIVKSGVNLGKKAGFSKVYSYRTIGGKDFYFAEKAGKVRICYDGKLLPNEYDKVVHYQCCEPAHFNPGGNEHMVCFHALKAGYWHYVEAGVYKD